MGPAPISALALALVSSAIYGLLCLYTGYKIHVVRASEKHARQQRDHPSSESATLISEEDLQRKQFGRLLSQSDRSSPSGHAGGTYRVDIPDNVRLGRNAAPVQLQDTGRSVSPYSEHGYSYDTASGTGVQTQTSFEYVAPAPPRIEGKAAALQAARERTEHNKISRERRNRQQQGYHPPVPTQPPVIVNSRNDEMGTDLGAIPLSDRHPLEREEPYVPGRGSKDGKADRYIGPTYRPDSPEYAQQPKFEIIEDEEVHFDLGATRRATGVLDRVRGSEVRNELEARMPRERASVVTDGDSGVGSWRSQARR